MKKKAIKILTFISLSMVLTTACTKNDNNDKLNDIPTTVQADNNWFEDDIAVDKIKWYKIIGEETFTTLYVEWAELDNHGESRNYTANIKVSAYKLDGVTPYFEEKNNGYKDSKKAIELASEKEILVKVELNDTTKPGTFALRSTGTGVVNLEYTELTLGSDWAEATIESGETLGFLVKYDSTSIIEIIWAEVDSPEEGYTANINGSVLKKDGETPYKQYGKDDDFLNKKKSHSDNPKAVETDAGENKIKIHITEAGSIGTFAIKARKKQE